MNGSRICHYPHLTRAEFDDAAKHFLRQAHHAGGEDADWKWIEHERVKGFGYLATRRLLYRPTALQNSIDQDNDDTDDSVTVKEEPDQSSIDVPSECLTVDYHIIYSSSYRVPVLYFNAYYSNGSPLSIDDIFSHVIEPSRRDDLRTAGFNGAVSQQDHPTLMIPFYYLHPCETPFLLKNIVDNTRELSEKSVVHVDGYLRSWLSLIGPTAGIKVGIGLFLDSN
ncbi:3648_t:CDS:2 [Paraglomus occultum]|uniref:Ubiquitin-like-conjugating enzyme ATG10 n=1 Tax=Paraglomus occultum TaxID=144539 RepID=A0A9N9B820_9GLOM|nr:3648_t:CDS:2 [Paraglomus occultum]